MGFHKSTSLTEKGTAGHEVRARDTDPSVLETDDHELVKRARNGDPRATEQLLKRYYQKAYGIAYRMCSGDEEEARDLVQDAFLNVLRNLKKFKGDSRFYTWLYRIVVNTCLDARRRRQRRSGLLSRWLPRRKGGRETDQALEDRFGEGEEDSRNPMSNLSEKQLRKQLLDALEALSEKQRVAFELKVFEGMSVSEIAQVMKTAQGTVKSHLFRATRYMRRALADWVEP